MFGLNKKINKQKIIIFCGAGISQESGLNTFRDSTGLWNNHDVNQICNIHTFKNNRITVFNFYNDRKKEILNANFNQAHHIIANIQNTYGVENVLIYTSNIDNLLEEAGCKNVIHVHGDIFGMLCIDCHHSWNIGNNEYNINDTCPACNSIHTKPNIVFFNEIAPQYDEMKKTFDSCGEIINNDIIKHIKIIVGTSLKVITPYVLKPSKSRSILVDLNPDNLDGNGFEIIIKNKATTGMIEAEKLVQDWYLNK